MAAIVWLLVAVGTVSGQKPYGLSQLDNYARILNSGNIAGLGQYNEAIRNGQYRTNEELTGHARVSMPQFLSVPTSSFGAAPPIPNTVVIFPQAEVPRAPAIPARTVLTQPTSTGPVRPTAPRQSPVPVSPSLRQAPPAKTPVAIPLTPSQDEVLRQLSTRRPIMENYGVNVVPELPPQPESKIGGYFDDDGEFHPFPKTVNKRDLALDKIRKARGAKSVQVTAGNKNGTPFSRVATAEGGSLKKKQRVVRRQLPVKVTPSPPLRGIHTRQVHQKPAPGKVPVIVPPIANIPEFIYRPRPRSLDREIEVNNLLAEVEEYDDWLDQRETYQTTFPGTRVSNPFETLPPGTVLYPAGALPPQQQAPGALPVTAPQQGSSQQGPLPPQIPTIGGPNALPRPPVQGFPGQPQLPPPNLNSPALQPSGPQLPASATENPLVSFLMKLLGPTPPQQSRPSVVAKSS